MSTTFNISAQNEALNARLLAAHETGDAHTMAALYEQAAKGLENEGEEASAAFYYTQAYVFALEAGSQRAHWLEDWLRKRARH